VEEARRKKGGAGGVVDSSSSFSPLIVSRCCRAAPSTMGARCTGCRGAGAFRGRTPRARGETGAVERVHGGGLASRRGRHLDSCWIKLESVVGPGS